MVGGGTLATWLLNHDLIDRLLLHIMPVLLGEGISFLEPYAEEANLKLLSCKKYSTGAIELMYDVNPLLEEVA